MIFVLLLLHKTGIVCYILLISKNIKGLINNSFKPSQRGPSLKIPQYTYIHMYVCSTSIHPFVDMQILTVLFGFRMDSVGWREQLDLFTSKTHRSYCVQRRRYKFSLVASVSPFHLLNCHKVTSIQMGESVEELHIFLRKNKRNLYHHNRQSSLSVKCNLNTLWHLMGYLKLRTNWNKISIRNCKIFSCVSD